MSAIFSTFLGIMGGVKFLYEIFKGKQKGGNGMDFIVKKEASEKFCDVLEKKITTDKLDKVLEEIEVEDELVEKVEEDIEEVMTTKEKIERDILITLEEKYEEYKRLLVEIKEIEEKKKRNQEIAPVQEQEVNHYYNGSMFSSPSRNKKQEINHYY
jgi:hypothetical protein